MVGPQLKFISEDIHICKQTITELLIQFNNLKTIDVSRSVIKKCDSKDIINLQFNTVLDLIKQLPTIYIHLSTITDSELHEQLISQTTQLETIFEELGLFLSTLPMIEVLCDTDIKKLNSIHTECSNITAIFRQVKTDLLALLS